MTANMHLYYSRCNENLNFLFFYFFITCGKFLYCLNLFLTQSSVVDPHLSNSAFEVPPITTLHTHSDAILSG